MSAGVFVPSSGKVNVAKAFKQSFDDLDDMTVIADPLGAVTGEPGYDTRPQARKHFADEYQAIDEILADGGSLGGAMHEVAVSKGLDIGAYALPTYPLEDLSRLTTRRTPTWDLMPKIARNSNTVEQDSVTDLASPEIGGERAVPNDVDDTTEGKAQSMTYYRIRGSVSGPMGLASSGFRNAMGVEQQNKSQAMAQFGENLVLNGDPTAGTTDGSIQDERAYKGLRTLATDNNRDHEPESGAGSTITAADVRENFRRAVQNGGNPQTTVQVTDLKTVTDLKNELDQHDPVEIMGGPDGSVNIGAQSVMVDGHQVIASDFMPNTDYDGNNPDTTGRELLAVDMRFHGVHDLSSTVMEALGKQNDADEFFMKRYSTMLQHAGAHQMTSLLINLA